LNANIIIPRGLLNEIDFLVDDEECRNAIKVCLQSRPKEAVVGGRRVKHEISLRTDRDLANELRRRQSFRQIQGDYRKALGEVRDEVDKALISLLSL
jgi:hypothetical protein